MKPVSEARNNLRKKFEEHLKSILATTMLGEDMLTQFAYRVREYALREAISVLPKERIEVDILDHASAGWNMCLDETEEAIENLI